MRKFVSEFWRLHRLPFETQWFQQDDPAPHTAKASMEFLKQVFGNRLIALCSDRRWAPRSPDLSPLDFFLWGYCKEKVYKSNPKTVPDLKRSVEDCVKSISEDLCIKVIGNFKKRIDLCIQLQGCHFEHLQVKINWKMGLKVVFYIIDVLPSSVSKN